MYGNAADAPIESDREQGIGASAVFFAAKIVWRTNRSLTAAMGILQVVLAGAVAAQLYFLSRIAMSLEQDASTALSTNWLHLAGFTSMMALISVIGQVSFEVRVVLAEILERDVMAELLSKAQRSSVGTFENPSFHDRLLRAMRSAQRDLFRIVSGILTFLSATLQLVAVGLVLAWIAPIVLVVSILAAFPLVVSARLNTRSLYAHAYELTADDRRRSYLEAILLSRRHAPELQLLGARRNLGDRVRSYRDERIQRTRMLARRRALTSAAAGFVTALVAGAALVVLVREVSVGNLELAEAAVAVVALQQVRGRSTEISAAVSGLHEAATFVDDYRSFVTEDEESGAVLGDTLTSSDAVAPSIELDQVTFEYPETHNKAVDGISLTIPAGGILAIVGENGSGKSTLAKLITGVYEPTEGRVLWNGVAGAGASAPILQDFARFELSGWDNLALGEPDAPLAEDRAAASADASGIGDVLRKLPNGFASVLSREFADGTELSGGEWQRLATARAFYRRAGLLVLDEPTSALDARAEAALFAAIRAQASDRTVVIISHRFATVRDADLIAVLHEGVLEDAGTHSELMERKGRYAELFELQASPFFRE